MIEPLNIISESFSRSSNIGGPNKVIINAIKGLNKINYPFVLNQSIYDYKYNWIHDSIGGLIEACIVDIPAIVGPNLVVLPSELPWFLPSMKKLIFLHPSKVQIELWDIYNFHQCLLNIWPVGIDADDFNLDRCQNSKGNVMIYLKRRNLLQFNQIIELVKSMGLSPQIIRYGEYDEKQYRQVLTKSEFGIWLGVSESQGIGLQEALASGLPLIVFDVNSLFESSDKNDYYFFRKKKKEVQNLKSTSAPYFDERCGIIINDFSKLEESIDEMCKNLSFYNPREYIIENLTLEKQAFELLSFFDILKQQNPCYFLKLVHGNNKGNFKLSFHGKLIYSFFLLRRKTKTMFRLIKNYFKK